MQDKFSSLNSLLSLGDPRLHALSLALERDELDDFGEQIGKLNQIILEFRQKYGSGRAVAAPQIGLFKRIICWNIDSPVTMVNPVLTDLSAEMMEIWDDCMCFPGLLVKVKRHVHCTLSFHDENWIRHRWQLEGDQSELIQHEMDHLNGILATQRAIDNKSFKFKKSETIS